MDFSLNAEYVRLDLNKRRGESTGLMELQFEAEPSAVLEQIEDKLIVECKDGLALRSDLMTAITYLQEANDLLKEHDEDGEETITMDNFIQEMRDKYEC